MDIWSILQRAEELHARAPALREDGRPIDYAELGAGVRRIAALLRQGGLAAGERVAILEWNSRAFLETYFAAAGLGAILVPLNVRLSAAELAAILRDSEPRWLIANSDFSALERDALLAWRPRAGSLAGLSWIGSSPDGPGEELEAVRYAGDGHFEPVRAGGGSVAQLYYTSGTTGRPKGVMLTHDNVCIHALAAIAELQLTSADAWGHCAPMFHLADAWACFALTWAGGRHVMLPRFEPAAAIETLARERVTITNLIPAMLNAMVKHSSMAGADLSAMRAVLSGGAPIAPEVVRSVVHAFGCEYVQTYGMTETSPFLALSLLTPELRALPLDEQMRYRAKTGRPFLTVELEVRAEDGRPVARDGCEVGEICVRGPTVSPGYWKDEQATRAAFRDGWLLTGDLATQDERGWIDIVDRKKDMIISGGEKIYSTEVEAVLYRHPAVFEAAVYGLPDEEWGEVVTAAVVLKSGEQVDAGGLIEFCRARLSGFKVPKRVVLLSELPRTGSGKIHKRALRENSCSQSRGETSVAGQEGIIEDHPASRGGNP